MGMFGWRQWTRIQCLLIFYLFSFVEKCIVSPNLFSLSRFKFHQDKITFDQHDLNQYSARILPILGMLLYQILMIFLDQHSFLVLVMLIALVCPFFPSVIYLTKKE